MHVRAPWPTALAAALLLLMVPACGDDVAPRAEVSTDGGTSKPYAEAVALVQQKRAEILPDESERRWEEIDWQATYADGLKASADQQKPLMLWVMNGHPLGCT